MVSACGSVVVGATSGALGVLPCLSPSAVLGRLDLKGNPYFQSRLMRPPLRPDQTQMQGPEHALTDQLGQLVSIKGADLMLNSAPDEFQGHQRLRRTINPKMWRWKVVSSWKWLGRGGRINYLELRASLACLRWR